MSCSPNIVAWCTFKVPPHQTPRTLLYQARPCAAYGRGLGMGARILETEQVCLNEACLLKLLPCLQSALGTWVKITPSSSNLQHNLIKLTVREGRELVKHSHNCAQKGTSWLWAWGAVWTLQRTSLEQLKTQISYQLCVYVLVCVRCVHLPVQQRAKCRAPPISGYTKGTAVTTTRNSTESGSWVTRSSTLRQRYRMQKVGKQCNVLTLKLGNKITLCQKTSRKGRMPIIASVKEML
jgi:hypothetical protein